jgi:hypothetical protein
MLHFDYQARLLGSPKYFLSSSKKAVSAGDGIASQLAAFFDSQLKGP